MKMDVDYIILPYLQLSTRGGKKNIFGHSLIQLIHPPLPILVAKHNEQWHQFHLEVAEEHGLSCFVSLLQSQQLQDKSRYKLPNWCI